MCLSVLGSDRSRSADFEPVYQTEYKPIKELKPQVWRGQAAPQHGEPCGAFLVMPFYFVSRGGGWDFLKKKIKY